MVMRKHQRYFPVYKHQSGALFACGPVADTAGVIELAAVAGAAPAAELATAPDGRGVLSAERDIVAAEAGRLLAIPLPHRRPAVLTTPVQSRK